MIPGNPKPLEEEMLEYDATVRIPPISEYTIQAKIKSVEKATPRSDKKNKRRFK